MIFLTPFRYDSVIKVFQFMGLPTLLVSCYHLKSNWNFMTSHVEMNQLLSAVHGFRHFALLYVTWDATLMIFLAWSSLFKTRILRRQYLTDRQNCLFKLVIFLNLSACLSYLIFTCSTIFNNQFNEEDFMKGMLKGMATYPGGKLKAVLDRIQIKYRCCGTDGYSDWFNFYWYNKHVGFPNDNSDDVPFSCCSDVLSTPCIHIDLKDSIKYVGYFSVSNGTVWQDGCLMKFKNIYLDNCKFLVFSSLAVASLHILLAVGDRLIQTADSTFVVQYRFQAWLFGRGPTLEKMFLKILPEDGEETDVSNPSTYDRTVGYCSTTRSGSSLQNVPIQGKHDSDSRLGVGGRPIFKRKLEEDVECYKKKIKHVS